jgi:hypothetical protein
MNEYVIFHIDGGIGKNIAATAVIKSIKSAYPDRKLLIVTAYPEVYLHNINVHRVYKFGYLPYFYDDYIKNKNSIILRMEPYHSGDLLYRRKSLTEIWCDILNIPCVDKTPEIFLTQRELIYASNILKKQGPVLMIQSNGGADNQQHPYSWSRDLPPSFAQELVNELKPNFDKILHIGRQNQPDLQNTTKLTDSLRNIFCFILLSDKIIGIDSFVQHAAVALKKKATVGWISNSPLVFGYNTNHNVIATGQESFRHRLDSYLESDDWTGGRFYECPYDNINAIFKKEDFINSILK